MDLFELIAQYYADKPLTKEQQEENTKYLLNHPLFMKELPKDIQGNEELSALIALKQDEDPNQVAQSLNKQANKRLQQSPNGLYHMKQAYQKYSQAISINCPSAAINAKLHANRAQLNLKLKNYGKVLQDCRSCLKFDPNYVKGYFRYGKALLALQKYEDCIKILSPRTQPELLQLLNEAKTKQNKKVTQQNKKKQKKQQNQQQIRNYCEQKGWKYLKRDQPLPEGVKAQLIQNKLSIPLVILYPQFSQFDLIASSFQENKIKQLLKQILDKGLPWDTKKQYTLDNIEIYCEISQEVLMKIPRQAKLTDILARVPFKQALQVQIVSKNNTFYQSYIKKNKII